MIRLSFSLVWVCLFILQPRVEPAFGQGPPEALQIKGPIGAPGRPPDQPSLPQDRLNRVWSLAQAMGSTALLVVHQGRTVLDRGKTTKKTSSHSLRKSLMNALVGRAVDRGLIDLDSSLAQLGLDDRRPLSPVEKKATVRDLLMSKSGIYLPAAAESPRMKRTRPPRHTHLPGTHFYYNNWDFNALGTIFCKATGLSLGGAFADWVAAPLGMKDFQADDVRLTREPISIHPAYPFYITARDLALFGQLYLQDGLWRGKRIIPAQWIRASTTAYTFDGEIGYGYLWWTYRDLTFFGQGFGGQFLGVVPCRKLVLVNRVDTGRPGSERRAWLAHGETVSRREMGRILEQLLAIFPGGKDQAPNP